jgi:hypothetical protein
VASGGTLLAAIPLRSNPPGREAADVDVIRFHTAVKTELDLELHLLALHRQVADRAHSADLWPASCAGGSYWVARTTSLACRT